MVATINGQEKEEKDTEKRIVALINKHPQGITIVEIAKRLDLHRHTVSKYVYGLEKSGQIMRRRIGMVSLCYPKK